MLILMQWVFTEDVKRFVFFLCLWKAYEGLCVSVQYLFPLQALCEIDSML